MIFHFRIVLFVAADNSNKPSNKSLKIPAICEKHTQPSAPYTAKKPRAYTIYGICAHLVEATGIEPVSENSSGKLSTSVAYLLASLSQVSVSRLLQSVSRYTPRGYGRCAAAFTTDRRPNRDRGPSRQDGPLLSSSQF